MSRVQVTLTAGLGFWFLKNTRAEHFPKRSSPSWNKDFGIKHNGYWSLPTHSNTEIHRRLRNSLYVAGCIGINRCRSLGFVESDLCAHNWIQQSFTICCYLKCFWQPPYIIMLGLLQRNIIDVYWVLLGSNLKVLYRGPTKCLAGPQAC